MVTDDLVFLLERTKILGRDWLIRGFVDSKSTEKDKTEISL